MIEVYEVYVSGDTIPLRTFLAICYSRAEAELVRAAIERSKQFSGSAVLVKSLGRFLIARE